MCMTDVLYIWRTNTRVTSQQKSLSLSTCVNPRGSAHYPPGEWTPVPRGFPTRPRGCRARPAGAPARLTNNSPADWAISRQPTHTPCHHHASKGTIPAPRLSIRASIGPMPGVARCVLVCYAAKCGLMNF